MNPQFTQPKGPVSKETNKETIARVYGTKKAEVAYLVSGSPVDGYKVLYDKTTQTCWFNTTATGNATSWGISGTSMNLITSTGTFVLLAAKVVTSIKQGTIRVPEDYSSLNLALDSIKNQILSAPLTISIADGVYNTDTVLLQHPSLEFLTIEGRTTPSALAISAGSLVGGSSGQYQYSFTVPSGHGVSVGDVVCTRDFAGTGGVSVLCGALRVTAVTATSITCLIRIFAPTFPALTVTGGNLYNIKTKLVFTNVDGIVVKSDALGMLANIAVVGNMWDYWNSSDILGTEKGTHGIYIGANTIVDGKATPGGANPNAIAGGSISMRWVAVLDFDQQGICPANASSAFCRYTFASSCGRRGFYVGNSASIDARQCVATHNYLDGVICDYGGAFNTSGFWASGNRLDGVFAINGGNAIIPNTICEHNQQFGVEVHAGSYAGFDFGAARYNKSGGCHVEFAGALSCLSADISSNLSDGLQAYYGSSIRATDAAIRNNARYGINALSSSVACTDTLITGNTAAEYFNRESMIQSGSGFVPKTQVANNFELLFQSPTGNHVGKIAQTSIGDVILQADDVNLITFKSDAIFPTVDNTKSLGRISERFTAVYAHQLILGTGMVRCVTNAGSPEGSVTADVGSVCINTSGGEGTTLYVKETGTGNTGWAAK